MSGERARLFVALDLPAHVRSALHGWGGEHVGGMPRLRLVEPASLHVTLCFLGSRPVGEVDAIVAACATVSGLPQAPLALGDALWLPPRRPRVLTVELADEQAHLTAVQSTLARALQDGGFYQPEKRPFLAHVTVARVQRQSRPRRESLPPPEPLQFTGTTVTLYQSRLGPGPAHYQALSSVSLAS
ncbi:MAG: RNA 2',3'-cyclic phosphodiesterase [Solirubrobacteraceae bacterium]